MYTIQKPIDSFFAKNDDGKNESNVFFPNHSTEMSQIEIQDVVGVIRKYCTRCGYEDTYAMSQEFCRHCETGINKNRRTLKTDLEQYQDFSDESMEDESEEQYERLLDSDKEYKQDNKEIYETDITPEQWIAKLNASIWMTETKYNNGVRETNTTLHGRQFKNHRTIGGRLNPRLAQRDYLTYDNKPMVVNGSYANFVPTRDALLRCVSLESKKARNWNTVSGKSQGDQNVSVWTNVNIPKKHIVQARRTQRLANQERLTCETQLCASIRFAQGLVWQERSRKCQATGSCKTDQSQRRDLQRRSQPVV